MQVWSLGQEDTLKKEMATHSIILAWKIPFTEEPGRLQAMGLQKVGQDWEQHSIGKTKTKWNIVYTIWTLIQL